MVKNGPLLQGDQTRRRVDQRPASVTGFFQERQGPAGDVFHGITATAIVPPLAARGAV
jgi:hypothetical protein